MLKYKKLCDLISYPYVIDITLFGIPQDTYSVNDSEEELSALSRFGDYMVLFIEAHTDGYLIVSLEEPSEKDR